ncbi:hypothetical protein Tco_0392662 [Tanacetum coccineum]
MVDFTLLVQTFDEFIPHLLNLDSKFFSEALADHAAWVKGDKRKLLCSCVNHGHRYPANILCPSLLVAYDMLKELKAIERMPKEMLILHFMQYEQERFQKNQKNKPLKVLRWGHVGTEKELSSVSRRVVNKKKLSQEARLQDYGSKNAETRGFESVRGVVIVQTVEAIGTYHLELPRD